MERCDGNYTLTPFVLHVARGGHQFVGAETGLEVEYRIDANYSHRLLAHFVAGGYHRNNPPGLPRYSTVTTQRLTLGADEGVMPALGEEGLAA